MGRSAPCWGVHWLVGGQVAVVSGTARDARVTGAAAAEEKRARQPAVAGKSGTIWSETAGLHGGGNSGKPRQGTGGPTAEPPVLHHLVWLLLVCRRA